MPDLLVVAPTAPDLRGLHQTLGERIDGTVRGLHVTAKTVGVGMPASAVGAAKRVFQLAPRGVVLLGTCGVYPGRDYQPHDVIVGSSFSLIDHGVDRGQSVFPGPMGTRLDAHAAFAAGLASAHPRARAAPIGSPLAQSRDDQMVAGIVERHDVHAEHLEAFSIATTCQLAAVPFAAVLAVTHVVGSYGEDDWRKFQRQATLAASEILLAWIHGGSPGLPHPRPDG